MKYFMLTISSALFFLALVCRPSDSCAGISHVSIDASGVEEFSLFAMQMEGIMGLQIDISYDTLAMTNVQFEPTGLLLAKGSVKTGALSAGAARMNFTGTEAVEGSGVAAIMRYDRTSERYPGRILSASILATDERGVTSSIPVVINNPADSSTEKEDEVEAEESKKETKAEQTSQGTEENRAEPSAKGSAAQAEPAKSVDLPREKPVQAPQSLSPDPKPISGLTVIGTSVLDRFLKLEEGSGRDRFLKALQQDRDCIYGQVPRIALSDGITVIAVSMTLDIVEERAPNFLLKGARYKTLKKHDGGEWVLELLPHEGTLEASISVAYDGRIYEFPISVAPPKKLYAGRKSPVITSEQQKIDEYVRQVNDHLLSPADSTLAAK